MTKAKLTWLPKKTFELEFSIPWAEIKKTYDEVFASAAKELKLKGFRKGKAPEDLIKKNLDPAKIYGEVINRVLPLAYAQAIKEHQLKPAIAPKIQIVSAQENKPWQFKATSCELPVVKLPDYQKMVKGTLAQEKIWTPGKGEPAQPSGPDSSEKTESPTAKISRIIKALLEAVALELPDILIESERDRLLARLLQDAQKLGLSIEQYAVSLNKTVEQLKQEQKLSAEQTLKMELILQAIAEDRKIEVSDSEIDKMIATAQDEKLKKQLNSAAERAYIASVIKKRKAIDYLLSL